MVTKAERDLLDIIDSKSERVKELKLECGQQATEICVLNLRITELEVKVAAAKSFCEKWKGDPYPIKPRHFETFEQALKGE